MHTNQSLSAGQAGFQKRTIELKKQEKRMREETELDRAKRLVQFPKARQRQRQRSPSASRKEKGLGKTASAVRTTNQEPQQLPEKNKPSPQQENVDANITKEYVEPSYIRYISDGKNSGPIGTTDPIKNSQPQPGFMQYIADITGSSQFANGSNAFTGDTDEEETTLQNEAVEAQVMRREPNIQTEQGPGAYPFSFNAVDESEWRQEGHLDAGVESGNESNPIPELTQQQNTEGLAVANPVSQQFSLDLDEAEHMDPALAQQRREAQKKKNKILLARMLMAAIFLVTGIVLVLIFVVEPEETKSTRLPETEEANQTVASISDKELLLSLLPVHTAKSIRTDEFSPQAKAFAWLLEDPNFSSLLDWRKIQRFALATFFFATGGQLKNGEAKGKWLIKTHWLSHDHDECEWFSSNHLGPNQREAVAYGLVDSYPPFLYNSSLCSRDEAVNGKVERLVFFANGLVGNLPPELSLLTELRGFALINNPVAGTIPTEIGLLTKLEFFATVLGSLEGSLPSELGNTKSLTHLLFFRTKLSGSIPTELGRLTEMKGLLLDTNQMEGTLPTELGLLTNAVWVSAYENRLTGHVPTQLGRLSSARLLAVYRNFYNSGTLPSELGMLSSVQELNIEFGRLTGTLPTELGQLRAIENLLLGYNFFTGSIPSELGLLESMWEINVAGSQITGTIPNEMIIASKLAVLHLFNTLITGSIPTEIGLATNLLKVDMHENDITGPIPSQIGFLTSLVDLILRTSELNGSIPTEIGLASSLARLELFETDITGPIPSQIGFLTSLADLILRTSELNGSIPTEIGLASSLTRLELFETDITGQLPSQLGLLTHMDHLNLNDNQISGTIPSELGALPSLKFLGIRQVGNNTISGDLPNEICSLSVVCIEIYCDGGLAPCSDDCGCDCNGCG